MRAVTSQRMSRCESYPYPSAPSSESHVLSLLSPSFLPSLLHLNRLWDAFGIGANDVANAFSTAVNSGVYTMSQAAVVAVSMEFLGAVTAGAGVAGTIQKGVLDANQFSGRESLLQLCMVCALIASASWLQFANRFALPVSTT